MEALGVRFGRARHRAMVGVDVGFTQEDEDGASEGGLEIALGYAGTAESVGVGGFEIRQHVGAGVRADDAGGTRVGEKEKEAMDKLGAGGVAVDEVGGRGQAGGGFDVIEEAFDGGEGPLAGGAAGAVGGEYISVVEALEAGEVAIAESRDEQEKSVAGGEFAPLVTILVTVAGLSVHYEYDGGGGRNVRRGVEIDGQRRAVPGGEREETIAGAKFFRGGGEGADGGEEREEKGAREGGGEGGGDGGGGLGGGGEGPGITKLTSYVKVMAATLQPGGELHCTLMM